MKDLTKMRIEEAAIMFLLLAVAAISGFIGGCVRHYQQSASIAQLQDDQESDAILFQQAQGEIAGLGQAVSDLKGFRQIASLRIDDLVRENRSTENTVLTNEVILLKDRVTAVEGRLLEPDTSTRQSYLDLDRSPVGRQVTNHPPGRVSEVQIVDGQKKWVDIGEAPR